MRSIVPFAALCVVVPAQRSVLTLVDGKQLEGQIRSLEQVDGQPALRIDISSDLGGTRTVPLGEVLSFHGPAPQRQEPVAVRLVGGEELAGEVRAGDAAGEGFEVRSPVLGTLAIPVDRLDVMLFLDRAKGAAAEHFRIPDDAEQDEALFVPARRGFDRILGEIQRFTATGVLFQEAGAPAPHTYGYGLLAAVALRGGIARETAAPAVLLTRAGDRIGVELTAASDGNLTFRLEGGSEVELRRGEISALALSAPGRTFLSDLDPVSVAETSYFSEGDEALMPFQRDRTVTGGYLVADGLTYCKGLGVHSRSVLSYRVPDGARHFHAVAALDDEVLGLRVRGDVRMAVRLDDEELYPAESIKSGAAPRNLGLLKVRPGALLTLEVDFGEGLDLGDRVDWLGAVFLR